MQIAYPFSAPPAAGALQAVADGVFWLRMPLPFALDHINLWLIEEADGLTAIDTGIAMDSVKQAWQSALAERRLKRQIVTHFHPDHLGLAAWLEAETGAPLWMTQGEYLTAQAIAANLPPFDVASMVALFRRHGLDAARSPRWKPGGMPIGAACRPFQRPFSRFSTASASSSAGRNGS